MAIAATYDDEIAEHIARLVDLAPPLTIAQSVLLVGLAGARN